MKKTLYIFLISLIVTSGLYARDSYHFSYLSLKDGLSQITVVCILQDSKGYMWFGTRNGLNRFDGYNFDVFVSDINDESSISDNHILCITEDKDGNIWIGTNNGLNKLDIKTNKFRRYMHNPDNKSSIPHKTILSVYSDHQNNLWVGSSSGLSVYDSKTDVFQQTNVGNLLDNTRIHALTRKNDNLYIGTQDVGLIIYNVVNKQHTVYSTSSDGPMKLTGNYIKSIFMDSHDNLWIGTQGDGINVLKKGQDKFTVYNQKSGLTNDFIRRIIESPDGNILVGTFNGLNVIDTKTGEIDKYQEFGMGEGGLSHYSVIDIYFDRSQTLWVGTYAGGVCYYSKYGQKFHFYSPYTKQKTVLGILGPIVETSNNLYIATEGGGLLEMDKKSEIFSHYELSDPDKRNGRYIIKSLYLEEDKIYCGTNVGTIYEFDTRTKQFTLFINMKERYSIYHISKSMSGYLIAAGASQDGVILISKDKRVINRFPVEGSSKDFYFSDIRCVLEIQKNVFLIGARNEGLYYYDYNKKILKQYKNNPAEKREDYIPENFVSSIVKSNMGQIWIGTVGGGISQFDPKTEKFTTYSTKDGLLNNSVCMIVEDNDNHLWVSSITGLSEFNPIAKVVKNYSYSNGIKIDEFTLHAGLRLSNNALIFSGNNGFTSFNPSGMTINPFVPPIVLRGLNVNNNKISPNEDNDILSEQLDEQKKITLNYDQSNISIEYGGLNYIFPERNQYSYKLEGFDKEWNDVGSRRIAYYTNIPPGDYRFIVRGSNNDGIWNNEGTSILISVRPPFWKTWWAYCIYITLIVAIIAFIIRYFTEKKRLENDIKLKQMESKTIEEFHQARDKLFTNFSHELRTPLTLILNPLEDMVRKNDEENPQKKKNILLMRSNARRLLRLVNNLMDFQKRESGMMKLKVTQSDFVKFSQEMTSFFDELALSRNIQLLHTQSIGSLSCWFDKSLMEKVYFNFLSNAFKNVPNGGCVEVDVDTKQHNDLSKFVPVKYNKFNDTDITYLLFEIRDTGGGIEADELEKIFIPFYQVAQNEHSGSGTGLGLSLSQSIIEMHHGVIWAESPEGSGAIFRCVLPMDKGLFSENEIQDGILDGEITPFEIEIQDETDQVTDYKKKDYTILVVEDNRDVRQYIISHLTKLYNVIEASNGIEAIEKTIQHLPDLVITDLMMPKMDGIEMCTTLKKDLRTGHIPVIMITARAMSADMKEGYDVGADAYITKPFDIDVLLSRVENILQSREKLKDIYGKRFSLESLGVEVTSADERFMQKLYEVLERNVSNPELNLDNFCRDIGMSRANMYRKLKAITNLSPSEFIRNFRLEMGAKILKEAKLTVSEVYVAVGFNSHAYFSNCFKALYGMSPSEYANKTGD